MPDFLNYAGGLAIFGGALAVVITSIRTNATRIWKEEAEAEKRRADRLFEELEEVKNRLTDLENYTKTLVVILSTVDPQKLDDLRNQRGL